MSKAECQQLLKYTHLIFGIRIQNVINQTRKQYRLQHCIHVFVIAIYRLWLGY